MNIDVLKCINSRSCWLCIFDMPWTLKGGSRVAFTPDRKNSGYIKYSFLIRMLMLQVLSKRSRPL